MFLIDELSEYKRLVLKKLLMTIFLLSSIMLVHPLSSEAVSYSPAAGKDGSTAIVMDDPAFVFWAGGYEDYVPGTDVDAVWQTPEYALGPAAGTSFDIVSLGRGGEITLTFASPIKNGEGWDFAVFENAFNDYNLELAFVEVSSNGIDFVRFDNVSLTPDPVGAYGSIDTTLVNGFAGKYRQGFGTPFDLADLSEKGAVSDGRVDLLNITRVRIIDIIGDGSDSDSASNVIFDPFPTTSSAGFDLDAIGVSNGAPYPDGSYVEKPADAPPENEGEAGFGGQGGCFISSLLPQN